jgi:hypothetical protein
MWTAALGAAWQAQLQSLRSVTSSLPLNHNLVQVFARHLASAAMCADEQPAYSVAALAGASARQSGCRTNRTLFPVTLPHLASIHTGASLFTNHSAAFLINQRCVVRRCATNRAFSNGRRSFGHTLPFDQSVLRTYTEAPVRAYTTDNGTAS